ncbi:glycoside hydrolase family 10 protein [Actinocorallia aurea]
MGGTRTAVTAVAGAVLVAGCSAVGGIDPVPAPKAEAAVPGGAAEAPAECTGLKPTPDDPAKELRGMWIATVYGGDWPGDPKLPVDRKKAAFRTLLDKAKAARLNAVFVQIRPAGDAFYPSEIEPWSVWLTGKAGKDPGWNPLEFMIEEAHARNLEFHAWFNPYRVGEDNDRSKLAPDSPAAKNPSWAVKYGKYLWYDPGLPQVRDLAVSAVMDVVHKYDVDGIHMDDYFYPYPSDGEFPDAKTYRVFGAEYPSKAAWRRDNVNKLVKRLDTEVHAAKPWVRFGISPFGIWRNKSGDPAGSDTNGLDSYASIYGDARRWIRQGWLDYVIPQLYWPIGDPRADYRVLVPWWSGAVRGTDVRLFIGQGAYRVGADAVWRKPDEISRHLTLNARYPEVRGDVYFSSADVARDKGGFMSAILRDHYQRPALIPPWQTGEAPAAPTDVQAKTEEGAVKVTWKGDGTSYAVYRTAGEGQECAPVRPQDLIGTTRGTGFSDPGAQPGKAYTYRVTALDRNQHESAPGAGAVRRP